MMDTRPCGQLIGEPAVHTLCTCTTGLPHSSACTAISIQAERVLLPVLEVVCSGSGRCMPAIPNVDRARSVS